MQNLNISDNIILIGMPGCGKSATGTHLAKVLDKGFLDTDDLIRAESNLKLQEIITQKGLDEFLNMEERIVCSINAKNTVIATGGSVVLSKRAMNHLKSIGKVIYLELPFITIEKRIKNIKLRGIAKKDRESLLDVFNDRTPMYKKYADITVDCYKKHFLQIISEIKELVLKN